MELKQLLPNPWLKFNEANPVGKIITTTITNMKDGVIFCNLEGEIDGQSLAKTYRGIMTQKRKLKNIKLVTLLK